MEFDDEIVREAISRELGAAGRFIMYTTGQRYRRGGRRGIQMLVRTPGWRMPTAG
jgi:hypothetical protein